MSQSKEHNNRQSVNNMHQKPGYQQREIESK